MCHWIASSVIWSSNLKCLLFSYLLQPFLCIWCSKHALPYWQGRDDRSVALCCSRGCKHRGTGWRRFCQRGAWWLTWWWITWKWCLCLLYPLLLCLTTIMLRIGALEEKIVYVGMNEVCWASTARIHALKHLTYNWSVHISSFLIGFGSAAGIIGVQGNFNKWFSEKLIRIVKGILYSWILLGFHSSCYVVDLLVDMLFHSVF